MSNTVTAGIVSSVARQASELGVTQKRTDYIQVSVLIASSLRPFVYNALLYVCRQMLRSIKAIQVTLAVR